MKITIPSLPGLILLTVVCWLSAIVLFGSQSPWLNAARGAGLAAGCVLIYSGLAWAARRWGFVLWIAVGLLTLAGLCVPFAAVLRVFPAGGMEPYGTSEALSLFLVASLALVVAALLFHSGQALYRARPAAGAAGSNAPGSPAAKMALALLLGAVLLVRALQNIYWLTVWDGTTDPLGYLWLFFPVSAAILAGFVWSGLPAGRSKWAGYGVGFGYAALVAVLLVVVSTLAQQVDFRQLTRARAERVSQAIAGYHARTGRYPQDLGQLRSWNAPWLPEPVVIFGQSWCYQGGDAYYRLGYVDREHWSDPRLIGRIYRAAGEVPALPRTCEKEIAALQSRDPSPPTYTYWKESY